MKKDAEETDALPGSGSAQFGNSPASRRQKRVDRPYHHGDLREALLAAAEDILDREGIGSLTLRAAARNSGASHAAPKNHFGDLTGLLSELAAIGFRRFSAALRRAAEEETDPKRRGVARAKAYVRFAAQHPGLFQLMFRNERLDADRPALREAMDEAAMVLAATVDAGGAVPEGQELTLERAARMASAWSLVHGFSMLLLDGRIASMTKRLPHGLGPEDLLDEMLRSR